MEGAPDAIKAAPTCAQSLIEVSELLVWPLGGAPPSVGGWGLGPVHPLHAPPRDLPLSAGRRYICAGKEVRWTSVLGPESMAYPRLTLMLWSLGVVFRAALLGLRREEDGEHHPGDTPTHHDRGGRAGEAEPH